MTVSERAEAIFTTGSLQAPEFASLVGNIATAITATAKAQAEAMGAQGSYARPLVFTATHDGFRLAAAPRPKDSADVELDFVVHDIDDVALRTVVDTLFDDSRSLTSLPHAAQRPLANAASVMAKRHHSFSVTLQQRGTDTINYSGNIEHMAGLITEFQTKRVVTETIEDVFQFDGFQGSSDTIFLMIDGTSYAIKATDEQVRQVTGFVASHGPELTLDCTIEQTTWHKPGRKPTIMRRLCAVSRRDRPRGGEQFTLL